MIVRKRSAVNLKYRNNNHVDNPRRLYLVVSSFWTNSINFLHHVRKVIYICKLNIHYHLILLSVKCEVPTLLLNVKIQLSTTNQYPISIYYHIYLKR